MSCTFRLPVMTVATSPVIETLQLYPDVRIGFAGQLTVVVTDGVPTAFTVIGTFAVTGEQPDFDAVSVYVVVVVGLTLFDVPVTTPTPLIERLSGLFVTAHVSVELCPALMGLVPVKDVIAGQLGAGLTATCVVAVAAEQPAFAAVSVYVVVDVGLTVVDVPVTVPTLLLIERLSGEPVTAHESVELWPAVIGVPEKDVIAGHDGIAEHAPHEEPAPHVHVPPIMRPILSHVFCWPAGQPDVSVYVLVQ